VSGGGALRFSHIKDGILSFHPAKPKKPISYKLDDETVLERAPRQANKSTAVSKSFAVTAKAAGIPNARFHDIRAKSASEDSVIAQGRLGYTDAKTAIGYPHKLAIVSPMRGVKL
jgi:hypothetical protein